MKKILITLLLVTLPLVGAFGASPDYFTFTMGAGGGYDITGGEISAGTVFGVDYSFNDQFTGGFKFFKYSAGDVAAVNITIHPAESLSVSVYSGTDTAAVPNVIFGAGVGFDFFSKKDGLFTSLGVFVDWLAGSGGNYAVTSGGSLAFGLKTQFGL